MSDDLNNPNDPLDDLLAQARWPEPAAGSTQRFGARWRELRRARYAVFPALTAAAAVIAVALVSWHWVIQSRPSTAPQAAVQHLTQNPPATTLRLVGRPMTGLERTLY